METPKKIIVPPSPMLRRLGYGAGVSVFEMTRSPKVGKINSPWAIKTVIKKHEKNTLYGKRLLAEADLLRKMNHPNIVGFRSLAQRNDGRSCLIMEKCETCLGTLIEQHREEEMPPFPTDKILKMVSDIGKGLDYIHTKILLLHGDVKSYNILIKGDFEMYKLCDFGVSLPLNNNGELVSIKKNEDYIGTECWAAPEVFNDNPITSKTDIFSFGLIIWEMMSLQIPHTRYEDSQCSIDNSVIINDSIMNDSTEFYGTRPPVPDIDATEYKDCLSLFYCATEENPNRRPTAKHMTLVADEILIEKNN